MSSGCGEVCTGVSSDSSNAKTDIKICLSIWSESITECDARQTLEESRYSEGLASIEVLANAKSWAEKLMPMLIARAVKPTPKILNMISPPIANILTLKILYHI